MHDMNSFAEVIDRWPSMQALADDLGVPYTRVQVMKHRGRISADYWMDLVSAAKRRKIDGINLELLARLRAQLRKVA